MAVSSALPVALSGAIAEVRRPMEITRHQHLWGVQHQPGVMKCYIRTAPAHWQFPEGERCYLYKRYFLVSSKGGSGRGLSSGQQPPPVLWHFLFLLGKKKRCFSTLQDFRFFFDDLASEMPPCSSEAQIPQFKLVFCFAYLFV